jgi:hypothetical protein
MTSETDSLPAAGATTASTAPTTTSTTTSRGEPDWRLATKLVQGGILRTPFGETCEAIYMTSGYVYTSAEEAEAAFANKKQRFIYSRFSNPTVQMFEERMALLEGAEAARATATGMAAVFASLACQLRAGDRVVASDALFGSCQYVLAEILPRFGVETVFVDGRDLAQWRDALRARPGAVFVETPSNPGFASSMPAVAKLAHAAGPSSSSTMSSPPRCCSGPWSWAPISSRLFRDQAYRRPGPRHGRRDPRRRPGSRRACSRSCAIPARPSAR